MLVVKTIDEYDENDFYGLYDKSWSGAIDTLDDIKKQGLEEDFMQLLNDTFEGQEVDATELNDYIWFEREDIYGSLGLDENGEKVEG